MSISQKKDKKRVILLETRALKQQLQYNFTWSSQNVKLFGKSEWVYVIKLKDDIKRNSPGDENTKSDCVVSSRISKNS